MSQDPPTREELEEAYRQAFQIGGLAVGLDLDEAFSKVAQHVEHLGHNAPNIDDVVEWLIGDAVPPTGAAEAAVRLVVGPACAHVPIVHEKTPGYMSRLVGFQPNGQSIEIEVRVKIGDKEFVKNLTGATRTDLKRTVGDIAGLESPHKVYARQRTDEIRRAAERVIASGLKINGIPVGMRSAPGGFELDDSQFKIIEYMIRMKRQQRTPPSIASILNKEGLRTTRKGNWQAETVRKIIKESQVLDDVARSEISLRVKSALAAKKKAGESTGTPPYGHRVDERGVLCEDAKEQEVIQTARFLRGQYMSYRAILRALSARCMFSRVGKPFTLQALYTMIGSPDNGD